MSSQKESNKGGDDRKTVQDVDESTKPDFIYGGPFIKVEKYNPFINTSTPLNLQLQGTFKKSFAYYSLKERMPVILTKVIDYLSREGSKLKAEHGATEEDILGLIQYITKLKNDLITNKKYDLLTVDTPEARNWNKWIQQSENQYYFTNIWVFTECYVYRRLREGCELCKTLVNFDPFEDQKHKSFEGALELMCAVADRLVTILPPSDKDKRKADFATLLKICLWANKCDLSLSMGEQVSLKSNSSDHKQSSAFMDPFQMIIDFKDKVLVDDSNKICDQIVAKSESIAKAIAGKETQVEQPPPESKEGEVVEENKIPCPAKMTIPSCTMFDIICDNAGYELFSDLCLAHFLISQNIVQKVRFHVKRIPWFVSDVTPADFKYTIESCKNASYNKELPPEEKTEEVESENEESSRVLNSDNLKQLGEQWSKYVEEGIFVLISDDFWTSPHVYSDMKKYAPELYRTLQFGVTALFKGDLNYRKLLGEKNCIPTLGFESALQGFNPTPVVAVRTIKADLICGLPKGKFEQISKMDEKWMEKGDYGVIQFCGKSEPLKVSDRPCQDYGDLCRGTSCPKQTAA